MKYDEFAFFNQQLAAMLRDGIPLEGALRRLCAEMQRGQLRNELEALEADLARGTPMASALQARDLPDLYKRMILVGVKSNDLPGALTMLADYFQRQSSLWMRLKGLMAYPLIVLFVAFLISTLVAVLWVYILGPSMAGVFGGMGMRLPAATMGAFALMDHIWIFPFAFGLLFASVMAMVFVPALQKKFRWCIPAFKEASVSRVAASLNMLLKGGVALPDAIGLVEQLESNTSAAEDLMHWRRNIASGVANFSEIAATNRVFPPMFVWTVANAGDDLANGFNRASEIYQARAIHRTEVALYSVLPIAAFILGMVVLSQAYLVISMFLPFFSMISNLSGS
jgi:type II secretory pathway component PulF